MILPNFENILLQFITPAPILRQGLFSEDETSVIPARHSTTKTAGRLQLLLMPGIKPVVNKCPKYNPI